MFRLRLLYAVASIIVGLVLFPFGIPVEWIGAALLLAGLALLWHVWGQQSVLPELGRGVWRWSHQPLGSGMLVRADVFSFVLIAATVYLMIPEVVCGQPPVAHDHMVHLVKALQLKDNFLAEGRLWGWSHNWFAGYPAQYLYPFGADLWVVAVYALGLGKLSINQAYAFAFSLHWLLMGVALYLCGRRAFSPIVCLLATLFFLLDIGAFRMGGWLFVFRWGVWPISFSIAFSLLAITQLRPILQGNGWRHVGWFGLWMGLALWTHPIQVIHFAVLFPMALLAYAWSDDLNGWFGPLSRLGAAFGIGLCIGGLWLFPFLSMRAYSPPYGLPWYSTAQFASELFQLKLFKGTWGMVTLLGLFGLFRMLLTRRFYLVYFGFFSFAMLVVSPRTFVEIFHLLTYLPTLKNIQTVRFVMLVKPFLFLGCAWLLVDGMRVLARILRQSLFARAAQVSATPLQPPGPWAVYVRVLLCVLIIVPITGPLLNEAYERHIQFFWRDIQTPNDDRFAASKQALVAWARPVFKRSKGFFRLAIWTHRNEHLLMDLGPRLSVPLYKLGSTPASIFRYKMETRDPAVMRYVNVRYLVADDRRKEPYVRLVRRFDKLYLYEFKGWSPDPFTVHGKGQVTLKTWRDEDIVLQAGAGAQGELRLHVSVFPRWTATHNGKPIAIKPFSFPNLRKTAFLSVPLKPGRYHFRFRRGWVEIISFCLMLLGFLLCFVTLWLDSAFAQARRLREVFQRWQQRATELESRLWKPAQIAFSVLLFGVLAIGLFLGLQKRDRQLEPKEKRMLQDISANLMRRIEDARVSILRGRSMKQCHRKGRKWYCWRGRRPAVSVRKPFAQPYLNAWDNRDCLWFRHILKRPIMLRFHDVTVGDVVLGDFTLNGRPKTAYHDPVLVIIFINDRAIYLGQTRQDALTHNFAVPVPPQYRGKKVTVRIDVRALKRERRFLCLRVLSGPLRKGFAMPKFHFQLPNSK